MQLTNYSKNIAKLQEQRERYRWELVEQFRKRSDESSTQLRAILIAIATASIGFIYDKNYAYMPNFHLMPVLAFAGAIIILVYSWSLQKEKSIKRLKWLRDKSYAVYLNREKRLAKFKKFRNSEIDKRAVCMIVIGGILEIFAEIIGHLPKNFLSL